MTREEAIEQIEQLLSSDVSFKFFSEDKTALNMAIESLSADEVVRCKDCKKQFTNGCYMIYGKNMMRNLFDNDFCSYGERREECD